MSRHVSLILLTVILLSFGCSQNLYMKGIRASREGDYELALASLYHALEEKPEDYRAWCEIGIIYYKNDSPGKAEEAFGMSNRIKPNAPSSLYLGLIFERGEQLEKAINLYGSAINLEGNSDTRDMIRDRLSVLIDKKLERNASLAIRNESDIDTKSIPDNTIAVINFDGSTLQPEMKPLALGIAEFTATDLAKVSRLNVVERIKINTILDELKFNQSQYADPKFAPRVGRLLGSRRMVLGTITGTGEESFRIDGILLNTVEGKTTRTKVTEGQLKKFFEVQKEFVFNVIDTLGIELTKKERDAIEEVPTESFLAFMAFSRGLYYQQQGMYEEATKSFGKAKQYDPGFAGAAGMAKKAELNLSYSRDKNNEKFRQVITASLSAEGEKIGLDNIQTINLINSGFVRGIDTPFDFGINPLAPPGGGPIRDGYGVIIIGGNLDAD
ncbi:hypothetical protein J7M07_08295 [bacterium]|nr:hypothetical protein [bacterium]